MITVIIEFFAARSRPTAVLKRCLVILFLAIVKWNFLESFAAFRNLTFNYFLSFKLELLGEGDTQLISLYFL